MKIKKRLILNYLIFIFLSLLILGSSLIFSIGNYSENYYIKELSKDSLLIAEILNPHKMTEKELVAETKRISQKTEGRITILDRDGHVLGDSSSKKEFLENHSNRPEIKKALQNKLGIEKRYSQTLKSNYLYIARPIKLAGCEFYIVRLSLGLENIDKEVLKLKKILFIALFLSLLLSFLISLYLARSLTSPLEKMSDKAKKIARGSLSERINIKRDDELGDLAADIDLMADALEKQIQEIERNKHYLETILNNMASAVLVLDFSGKIKTYNQRFLENFSLQEDILSKDYRAFLRNSDLEEALELTKTSGQEFFLDLKFFKEEELVFRTFLTPIIKEDISREIILVFQDITQLKRLEKIKADFVSNASHELRTPVTSIKGFIETLLGGALADEKVAREFLEIIDYEAERLILLINDLLDLSRAENISRLEKEVFSLDVLLEDSLSLLDRKIEEGQIDLNLFSDGPVEITANRNLMKQVLINILDNALKYNKKPGRIEIEISKEAKSVVIRDGGLGIKADDLERIFERFYRVDKARSQAIKGTGLGLSIAKHILDKHGFIFEIRSQENIGTEFIIYF